LRRPGLFKGVTSFCATSFFWYLIAMSRTS
jgi:hypothetical protein